MLQIGRDLDLAEEPLDPEHGAKFGVQDLERDVAVMPEIARQVDYRHAAAADLAIDGISAGQCGVELGRNVHGANIWCTWVGVHTAARGARVMLASEMGSTPLPDWGRIPVHRLLAGGVGRPTRGVIRAVSSVVHLPTRAERSIPLGAGTPTPITIGEQGRAIAFALAREAGNEVSGCGGRARRAVCLPLLLSYIRPPAEWTTAAR
jgi:hypothetical protein